MANKVKSNAVIFRVKLKKKLGRHTKHMNKHKSSKPSKGQG
jgi:hypothetical protein